MEVRRAGKEEELVDQESQDVRGAEKERHAEEPRGRHQQRAGKKEKEEIAGRPGTSPISPPALSEWRPEWIPAYLSNGLIGLRVGTIPLIEGLCIVNGLAAVDPVEQGEAFARGPYPIGGDLELDGRKLSRVPREARLIEQRYDFSCGQFTSRVASQMHQEPHRQAARLAGMAIRRGFKKLREENAGAWEEIWKGRIRLVGADPHWQAAADAAYYYLHASAHSSSLFSTSMFGLAFWPNYHYYKGHVMWDIENFAFPTLLLTAPEAARGLLAFRFERMQAAENNAAMFGYRGLQFPWAAGPRHGEEVIRLSAPQIVFEQHVGLSIALAFAQYVHATGDQDYLREKAWPILEGIADWITSRALKTDRGYEVKEVIGVAEQTDPVDNKAYVNMAAARGLSEAAGFARRSGRRGAERCENVAERW